LSPTGKHTKARIRDGPIRSGRPLGRRDFCRRETLRADAKTLDGSATPVDVHDPIASDPGGLSRRRWVIDPARGVPAHEMQVEELACTVAIIGQATASPEPTLRIAHGPVMPSARAQDRAVAFDEQQALPERILRREPL